VRISTPFNSRVPKEVRANLRWRASVFRRVIENPAYADVIIDACSRDPLFFINGFVYTRDTRREPFSKLPFILYPFQEEAVVEILRAINSHDLLIEKSRDMGASWITVASIFWCWMFRGGRDFLLGSRTDEYVDKSGNPKAIFQRLDYMIDGLPRWLLPKGFNKGVHRTKSHIENPERDSVMDGEATTESFARGDRRSAILLDEFADCKFGNQVLEATMPATPCRLFNSTPKGVNNAFYSIRQTDIKKLRLHWSVHPIKAIGLYSRKDGIFTPIDEVYWTTIENPEEEMQKFDSAILRRGVPLPDGKVRSPWYAEQCNRAGSAQEIAQEVDIDYLGSGYLYFNVDAVNEAIRKHARPPFLIGELEYDETTGDPLRFREDENGNLKLWFLLDKNGKPSIDCRTVIGNDISAGSGASNSCASGWNALTQEKILEYANPNTRPEQFAILVVALAKWLGGSFLIWESGGPGGQFGSRVRELKYSNIYYRKNDASISGRVSDMPGVAMNREIKLVLMGHYRAMLEGGKCVNRSKVAVEETLEYIFTPDGSIAHSRSASKNDPSGAKSNHGDRCMADALASKGMSERIQKSVRDKPEIPPGCLKWRMIQKENDKRSSNRELSREWVK